MIASLFTMMHNHYISYDMAIRPSALFRDPPMANPVEELTTYNFCQNSGCWPDKFSEISENLTLIPDIIICGIQDVLGEKTGIIFDASSME
jgi:hypothetical protein